MPYTLRPLTSKLHFRKLVLGRDIVVKVLRIALCATDGMRAAFVGVSDSVALTVRLARAGYLVVGFIALRRYRGFLVGSAVLGYVIGEHALGRLLNLDLELGLMCYHEVGDESWSSE